MKHSYSLHSKIKQDFSKAPVAKKYARLNKILKSGSVTLDPVSLKSSSIKINIIQVTREEQIQKSVKGYKYLQL